MADLFAVGDQPAPAPAWRTSVPDWEQRIRDRRSLIPDLPLYDAVAEKALRIFKRLRVPDLIASRPMARSATTGCSISCG